MSDTPLGEQLSAAYLTVRANYFATQDKIEALMKVESALVTNRDRLQGEISGLNNAAEAVRKSGHDPAFYVDTAAIKTEELQGVLSQLGVIEKKLELTRDLWRHLDEAHNGLHWGRFSEEKLASYCRENP